MPLNENDIALIGKHIDNELSQDEANLFNLRMNDIGFSDELALQKATAAALNVIYRRQLKEELRQTLSNKDLSGGVIPIDYRKRKYFYWAAAISLTALFSAVVFLTRYQTSAQSVFIASYKPYPATPVTRGNSEPGEPPAFQMYRTGDYQKAGALFEQLISEKDARFNETFLRLLLGNCYLNTNQLDKALASFQQVMNSQEKMLGEHAKWYYALTLLKGNKVDESVSVFSDISHSNSVYARQAKEVTEQLM